jgi:demethylmenaquinone methyltransferase/2-methoxy-6-polyprenyl-1,4-benzoquinol methylase
LRPGGRLLSLDFGKPGSPVLRRLYYRYLEASTTAVGWLLHRDVEAYLYIPESLRRYPAQRELIGLMQGTGFVRCGFLELLFGTMAINFGERPALASAS